MDMETRQLGNSDLHITAMGIGAWAIGGGGWNGSMGRNWPEPDEDIEEGWTELARLKSLHGI